MSSRVTEWHGTTARVVRAGDVVLKTVAPRYAEALETERWALTALQGCPHTPPLIGVDGATLVLGYAGHPVTRASLPPDWRAQGTVLLAALAAAGIMHRDIMPGNVLVRDGRLTLIDFGWAAPVGAHQTTPKGAGGLGDRWRWAHGYCDAYSWCKTMDTVLAGQHP